MTPTQSQEARLSVAIDVPDTECPAAWLVTAKSHLIDRFVADCEHVRLPKKTIAGGRVTFDLNRGEFQPPARRNRLGLGRKPSREAVSDAVLFDARAFHPGNWAHFLTNHLPVLFHGADRLGIDPAEIQVLLPADIPGYIKTAAALFGLQFHSTDAAVSGRGLHWLREPQTAIRAVRHEWAAAPIMQDRLAAAGTRAGANPNMSLPSKVFLSRRSTRNIENEAQIEAALATRGYAKIYPEDLNVVDQFRLFEEAEEMVAVHGAGLAPLLYRSPQSRLKRLIEVFPCGHMTDVFRVIAGKVGCDWVGVRGQIKPEHVKPAYRLDEPYLEHSLQSFTVDPVSLEQAFALFEEAHP